MVVCIIPSSIYSGLSVVDALYGCYLLGTTRLHFNRSYVITYSCTHLYIAFIFIFMWGRRGRDRLVVGFTTICAISAYHHWYCEFESRSGRGVQHYVISLRVTCDRSVLFPDLPVSSTNQTDHHDITEILLKVALNTIKQTNLTLEKHRKTIKT
jgi:hypothetical protein